MRRAWWPVLATVAVAVPLVVALAVLREPQWYPPTDDAQTELRVRDVGGADPPLTGLGGRIGAFGPDQGSHPGPISFWSLAGPYRLFGATSWALQVATAVVHVAAIGALFHLLHRRGGTALVVAAVPVLATLVHAYGAAVLTTPWNPYLPVLWWVAFVVGVWSLLCDDVRAAPVTVLAGSFCVQTHLSYVALVGGVGAAAALGTAARVVARRRDPANRRGDAIALVAALVVAAVVWFPPIAEQLTGSQGANLGTVVRSFADPAEEPLGLATGAELLLANVDPWRLLTEAVVGDRVFLDGPVLPGAVLVALWLASVVAAAVLGHGALLRLHFVLALCLVLGAVSLSRIFGPPWAYLGLWGWGTSALVVLAIGWTVGAAAAAATPRPRPLLPGLVTVGWVAVVVVAGAATVRAGVAAADAEVLFPEVNASSARIVPEVIAALAARAPNDPIGAGDRPRYLVTWEDPQYLGSRGFTLMNELERAGFDVGGPFDLRTTVTRHRVRSPSEATAQVHLAVGPTIAPWTTRPGSERIAAHDPAGPAGRAEYERLRRGVVSALADLGRSDLVATMDDNPGAFGFQVDLPADVLSAVARMDELGQPVAVFLGPPLAP